MKTAFRNVLRRTEWRRSDDYWGIELKGPDFLEVMNEMTGDADMFRALVDPWQTVPGEIEPDD